jgi:hypothetical protein
MSKYKLIFLFICLIITFSKQCPKYQCVEGTEAKCASVSSNLDQLGYNNIKLMDVCPIKQSCQIHPNPIWKTFATLDHDKIYTCKSLSLKRYPYEECKVDDDCMKFDKEITGKCERNYCSGLDEGQKCYGMHTLCKAGSYCDPDEDVCRYQKLQGQKCITSYEC